MRVEFGADHAGVSLTEHLTQTLQRLGHAVDEHNDLCTARLSREHNDANVLSIGVRVVAFGLADEILALWLDTKFEGGRHQHRIDQISDAERPAEREGVTRSAKA